MTFYFVLACGWIQSITTWDLLQYRPKVPWFKGMHSLPTNRLYFLFWGLPTSWHHLKSLVWNSLLAPCPQRRAVRPVACRGHRLCSWQAADKVPSRLPPSLARHITATPHHPAVGTRPEVCPGSRDRLCCWCTAGICLQPFPEAHPASGASSPCNSLVFWQFYNLKFAPYGKLWQSVINCRVGIFLMMS